MTSSTPSRATSSLLTLQSHDGLNLEAKLFSPGPAAMRDRNDTLAIVAHPYGPLGGTQNDPVVLLVVRTLLSLGVTCVTYNARGVGQSQGKGTWTAESEAKDYQTIMEQTVDKLKAEGQQLKRILACGYSAGSMAASSSTHPELGTAHILVSYPLDKLWALTLFKGARCRSAVEARVLGRSREGGRGGRVLMVQGSMDQFTNDKNYRAFHASLYDKLGLTPPSSSSASPRGGSQSLLVTRVEGADHFWSNSAHREELRSAVADFVTSLE